MKRTVLISLLLAASCASRQADQRLVAFEIAGYG